MIYSTTNPPRVPIGTAFDTQYDTLYSVYDSVLQQEFVAVRINIPGVLDDSEIQLWSPPGNKVWHFTGSSDPIVSIYDISAGFKLTFEQG